MEIGIRELRSNLSRVIDRVKAGEEMVITERGSPVARLISPAVSPNLQRLIDAGVITPAKMPKGKIDVTKLLEMEGPGESVSDIVIRQRG